MHTFNWGEVYNKVVTLVESFLPVCGTPPAQGNHDDSRFLMIGSQIVKLTFGPSFGHNLWFKYPNGSCEPILDIYVLRVFQWYKGLSNSMNFDPCNHPLKIWKSIGTPTPKVKVHLGVWGFIPSHSPTLPGAWNGTLGLHSWPTPSQALALVVSPELGLRHITLLFM